MSEINRGADQELTLLQREVLSLIRTFAQSEQMEVPPGTSPEDIVALSQRLGILIPPELRTLLLLCNAPNVGPEGIFGISPEKAFLDIEALLRLHEVDGWVDKGWIPIAGDGCGGYYVIATQQEPTPGGHPVYFVDESDYMTPVYVCASDVWRFLRFYLQAEMLEPDAYDTYWPFNEAAVLAEDPALALITYPPRPWEVN